MELANKTDEEILSVANPIMDNLMEGSTEIDHEKHTRDFTDRKKTLSPRTTLKESVNSISQKRDTMRS
jgi:hypothetical protein